MLNPIVLFPAKPNYRKKMLDLQNLLLPFIDIDLKVDNILSNLIMQTICW